jgi:hypothetical protein
MSDAAVPSLEGLEGPAVERQVAADLARRGLLVSPALIALGAAIWGIHGALSTAYGIVLVLANFALAALLMSWAARISLTALAVAALGGYVVRLALISVAVLAVIHQSWVSAVPLALTIGFTHLGLLWWETRYISATLAFPGLKPGTQKGA